jgi:tetratricopeptide (TPR) repeat protein
MLGDFYYANNQLDKATSEYAALYQDHPKDIVVKKNYIQAADPDQPAGRCPQVERRSLEREAGRRGRPDLQGRDRDSQRQEPSDAVNTLQAVLKNDPDNALAHYQLGLAFDGDGQHEPRGREWRDAVRLRMTLWKRTALWRALPSTVMPRDWRRKRTRSSPCSRDAPDGYLLRGVAEIDRKKYAAAEEYIHRSIEKQPNNP